MKQREDESFARFLPRFETELANAGALSFENSIKISLLENAVNRGMQERLVSVFPVPTEYVPYTSLLQTIGSRVEAFQGPQKQRTQQGANARQAARQASIESMDWEPTTAKIATTSTQRAKWVSQEELNDRRRTKRCFRCGASSHQVRECPYGPAQRPVTVDMVHKKAAKPKEVEPELEEEEASSDDSEN